MQKLLMQMQSSALSPNAHLRLLNPHVHASLQGRGVCTLPSQVESMALAETGSLSSFGYSGTIAHATMRHTSGVAQASMAPPMHRQRAFPWLVASHPFAQERVASSEGGDVFRSVATGALQAAIADHVVQGRMIFPGAGYLEMVRASASGGSALRGVFFLQPLAIEAGVVHVECAVVRGGFEVRSSGDSESDVAVHCSGAVGVADGVWRRADHASVRGVSCAGATHVLTLYDDFDAVGLQYGPGYRTLVAAWSGVNDGLARLRAQAST